MKCTQYFSRDQTHFKCSDLLLRGYVLLPRTHIVPVQKKCTVCHFLKNFAVKNVGDDVFI